MCRKLSLIVLLLCFVAGTAQAWIITEVERVNPLWGLTHWEVLGNLQEGSLCYWDRTPKTNGPGGHQYKEIPPWLLDGEYVVVRNDDRTTADYAIDVTLAEDCTLLLFIDNRVGDGDKATPPTLGNGVMNWVLDMGFVDTGQDISIDESGNGSIDNYFSIFNKPVSAGTIRLYEQNAGSLNMYGIAVPEPATIALLGLGALTLLRRRK